MWEGDVTMPSQGEAVRFLENLHPVARERSE
jgi:hypothetical protein